MPGKRKMQVQLLTAITGFSNPRKGVVKGGGGRNPFIYTSLTFRATGLANRPARGVPPEGGPLQEEGQV